MQPKRLWGKQNEPLLSIPKGQSSPKESDAVNMMELKGSSLQWFTFNWSTNWFEQVLFLIKPIEGSNWWSKKHPSRIRDRV